MMMADIIASPRRQAAAMAKGAGESAQGVASGRVRLLLIDADAARSRDFKRVLDAAGFEVELGGNGLGAGAVAPHFPVVMVAGDAPANDRVMLLRRLCESARAMLLLLLAAPGGDDVGTRHPASWRDHLTAAFQIEAVEARLQSLFARKSVPRAMPLRFGNVSIDGDGQLFIGRKVIHVQAAERAVLSLLMRRKGKIVPKRAIATALYGKSDGSAANAVEVCVHRLRRSLAANAATLRVITIRNAGYFIARHEPAN